MVRAQAKCILCLVTGAAAVLTGTSRTSSLDLGPKKTAVFGDHGSLSLQVTDQHGYTAVQWTTSKIEVSSKLVQEACGALPENQTFTYGIHDRWLNPFQSSASAKGCGEFYVGKHWDPTAACSEDSGNRACSACGAKKGYRCSPKTFDPRPDARGSFAYRFLNEDACELGDLSGMNGELEADASPEVVTIPALAGKDAGVAQMSAPFGKISRESVVGKTIGTNCDSSGPLARHGTNCKCLRYNGQHTPTEGTLTVSRPAGKTAAFYMAEAELSELEGKSVVVRCGSAFGDNAGKPLLCAKLK